MIRQRREVVQSGSFRLHLKPVASRHPPTALPATATRSNSPSTTAAAAAPATATFGATTTATATVEQPRVRGPKGRQTHGGKRERYQKGEQPGYPRYNLAAGWKPVEAHP